MAAELSPTDPLIAYNVAIIYNETGKTPEAITWMEKTIRLKPDYRDAYLALAAIFEQEKQPQKARETLELVLKLINPNDEEVKKRLELIK